jgi:hypothetical protein
MKQQIQIYILNKSLLHLLNFIHLIGSLFSIMILFFLVSFNQDFKDFTYINGGLTKSFWNKSSQFSQFRNHLPRFLTLET